MACDVMELSQNPPATALPPPQQRLYYTMEMVTNPNIRFSHFI